MPDQCTYRARGGGICLISAPIARGGGAYAQHIGRDGVQAGSTWPYDVREEMLGDLKSRVIKTA
eukprot:1145975-Prorocentrum_minimum.AAC.1